MAEQFQASMARELALHGTPAVDEAELATSATRIQAAARGRGVRRKTKATRRHLSKTHMSHYNMVIPSEQAKPPDMPTEELRQPSASRRASVFCATALESGANALEMV